MSTLKGISICVTGDVPSFGRRFDVESTIQNLGGEVHHRVTAVTQLLVAAGYPTGRRTSKLKAAEAKGIPIIESALFTEVLKGKLTVQQALQTMDARFGKTTPTKLPSEPRQRADAGVRRTTTKSITKNANKLIADSAKGAIEDEWEVAF